MELAMPRPSRENPRVRDFILRNVAANPSDIGPLAAEKFGLSRTAISGYIKRLIKDDLLISQGNTYARNYQRKPLSHVLMPFPITKNSSEDAIWRGRVLPLLETQSKNVLEICHYGFTEIFNNCIDHSVSDLAIIDVKVYYDEIVIRISDRGVGIFEKIRNHFGLSDARHALLELAKGKITSDRQHHAGEGIFFTSRMFNRFHITSGHLFYSREMRFDDDWLIENHDVQENYTGTLIDMSLSTAANWTTRQVFDAYQESGNISFRKTHVPIRLGKYPNEELVSRSQAKRILARAGDFSEVILDFEGIEQVGQAFADEIFRVFVESHPSLSVISIRTTSSVERMIDYVKNAAASLPVEDSFFSLGLLAGDSTKKEPT